jgi:hypothetical protein
LDITVWNEFFIFSFLNDYSFQQILHGGSFGLKKIKENDLWKKIFIRDEDVTSVNSHGATVVGVDNTVCIHVGHLKTNRM